MISVIASRPFHLFSLKSYLFVISEGFVERANMGVKLDKNLKAANFKLQKMLFYEVPLAQFTGC